MASNVFGNPITEGTRLARAIRADQDENADDKYTSAERYVRRLKAESGNGVSTLCLFYNATGRTMFYEAEHSWDGEVWGLSPPSEVHNGQWGAFLHVKSAPVPLIIPSGSNGYVIYRVKGKDDAGFCSTLMGWKTPWSITQSNDTHAFCNVYDDGKIDDKDVIDAKIKASPRQTTAHKNGMWMTTKIESDTSPLLVAYFKFEDALDSQQE